MNTTLSAVMTGLGTCLEGVSGVRRVKRGLWDSDDLKPRPAVAYAILEKGDASLARGAANAKLKVVVHGVADCPAGDFSGLHALIAAVSADLVDETANPNLWNKVSPGKLLVFEGGAESLGEFELYIEIEYNFLRSNP